MWPEAIISAAWVAGGSVVGVTINLLSLSLLPTDLLGGAQEKCELPPLEGFPHCEGKVKVNLTHTQAACPPHCLFLYLRIGHFGK